MAENPSWLDYINFATTRRELPKPDIVPVATEDLSGLSPQDRRLAEEQDLKKQVDRLRNAQLQGQILGADTEQPGGILEIFKREAIKAVDNPVVRTLFQALSVPSNVIGQYLRGVDWVNRNLNPVRWLADKSDVLAYGRVRTDEERAQSIDRKLGQAAEIVSPLPEGWAETGLRKVGTYLTEEAGLQAAGPYKAPSLTDFIDDVRNMRMSGEVIPDLKLREDATLAEKVWKLPLTFYLDIKSMGGPRGFAYREAGAAGRKSYTEMLGRKSEEIFKNNAKRLADETDSQFTERAQLFGARVTKAQNTQGLSRGAAKVFKDEFGEQGAELFKELPTMLKGGVGVGSGEVAVHNLNAGGFLIDDLAKKLGLDTAVFGSKWNPVVGFQSLKNTARLAWTGKILNSIGIESSAFSNFLGSAVKNASDDDLLTAYKTFMTKGARDPRGRMAEIISEEMNPIKGLVRDLDKLRVQQPALFQKITEVIDDPGKYKDVEVDEITRQAMYYENLWREQFDRVIKRLVEEGADVNYLENYYPVIFNIKQMKKDGVKFNDMLTDAVQRKLGFKIAKGDDVTKAGLVNVPGKQYDPTKERRIFTVIEEGTTVPRSATFKEMRETLLEAGVDPKYIKYLNTDPVEVLAEYGLRATRVLARKKLANELLDAGLLFRAGVPQLQLDKNKIQEVINGMTPDQLDRLTTEFIRDPNRLDRYVGNINQKLGEAYDSGNKEAIAKADADLKEFITQISQLGDVWIEKVMSPKALAAYRKKLDALAEAEDAGDEIAARKLRQQIDTAKKDAMKIRESAKPRPATIEANIERRAYQEFLDSVLNAKTTNTDELRRKYVLSDVGPLSSQHVKSVGRIPDEFAGTVAPEFLNETLGKWVRYNAKYALDADDAAAFTDAIMAGTQLFRTQATFGRGPGFVARNAIGAIFNNVLVAGVTGADYRLTHKIWWTRLTTDMAIDPLARKTGKDAQDYLDSLVKDGKLNQDAADLARGDILRGQQVSSDSIAKIKQSQIEERLRKYKVDGTDFTLADVYAVAVDGGVSDPFQSLAAYTGQREGENLASVLDNDADWISIRNDRRRISPEKVSVTLPNGAKVQINKPTNPLTVSENDPRKPLQRAAEAATNFGIDVKGKDRVYNLRPVQLVADLNRNTEEYHRTAAILSGMRKHGNTPAGRENAIGLMKVAQFDYSNLTEAERGQTGSVSALLAGRTLLPFYTWTRYNLPLQIRQIANQPGTYYTVVNGWDTVKNIMADENGDMYFMPEYLRETLAFMINPALQEKLLPVMQLLGADPSNPMAVRLESPILDLNKYFTKEGPIPGLPGVDVEELASGANPIFKAAIQFIAQKNLYTGKSYSKEGVEAPQWYLAISDAIGSIPGMSGARPTYDAAEGVYKVNERYLDIFKTAVPLYTTLDRTVFPVIDATANAAGIPANLTTSEDKALTSLLSSGLGLPITTVTPQTEAGEVASRYRYAEDRIIEAASRKRVNRDKLARFVSTAVRSGLSNEDIVKRGVELTNLGFFD